MDVGTQSRGGLETGLWPELGGIRLGVEAWDWAKTAWRYVRERPGTGGIGTLKDIREGFGCGKRPKCGWSCVWEGSGPGVGSRLFASMPGPWGGGPDVGWQI